MPDSTPATDAIKLIKFEIREACPVEGAKRQYVPALVHWICPACEEECEEDFTDHYFIYPTFGEAFSWGLTCPKCEHDVSVRITLRLTIEIEQEKS